MAPVSCCRAAMQPPLRFSLSLKVHFIYAIHPQQRRFFGPLCIYLVPFVTLESIVNTAALAI